MFDDVSTKLKCPYCGKENEVILGRIGFGHTVKITKCAESMNGCGKYFVADMNVSLSGTARKIDGM